MKDAPISIKRSFKIVYMTPSASKEPDGNTLERPVEWASIKDLPKCVPPELLRILTFQELVKHWQADPSVKISETNVRLAAFLLFYAELWQQL